MAKLQDESKHNYGELCGRCAVLTSFKPIKTKSLAPHFDMMIFSLFAFLVLLISAAAQLVGYGNPYGGSTYGSSYGYGDGYTNIGSGFGPGGFSNGKILDNSILQGIGGVNGGNAVSFDAGVIAGEMASGLRK